MSAGDRTAAETDRFEDYPHPRETTGLVGHHEAEAQMLEAYRSGRLPHAWVIGGPEGIGKATLAWRFARFVLANPDVSADAVERAEDLSVPVDRPAARQVAAGGFGDIAVLRREINDKTGRPYSEIRVDDVRRASGLFQQAARAGGYRICIIDSAEDLNASGANALLKLIEEPPPLSLFLMIAHRPAQLLPTLRSRCRLLPLRRMVPGDVGEVLRQLGLHGGEVPSETLALAAERGGGSVRGALHWLGGERLALYREISAALDKLPQTDWGGLHRIGDRIGAAPDDFGLLTGAVLDWLHAKTRPLSDVTALERRRLAPLTEVWDKIRRSARDAETFNLDKRTTILSIFADLAQATRLP